ncbi:DNA modification methylase [Endomicrobiia bacterium]|uniref:modification methylase n=1 Tax=Endomicrobium trichonymphae TaxID=1408204 RepID=UPI000865AB1E|nr:modification methylase [Candidatus Endomicrobium trichonymphae]BAV58935.1 type II modification methylase [Candidatus Endomicrobium trichonymphae]GHT23882.1 DNA modification methylase [Endomicrobiia bacterium]
MKYLITRNEKYDFLGQSYATQYPNIHKYPATMIPQIGIELLKEMNIDNDKLLDPYCGSGSSFTAGLENGFSEMDGFDINPLAVLISRTKFSKIDIDKVEIIKQNLRGDIYDFIRREYNISNIQITQYANIDYWFSKPVLQNLSVLKCFINKIDKDIQQIFLVPFSETIRECSYTKNNEFKLYRIKPEEVLRFNPDVFSVFFNKLNKIIEIYKKYYLPKVNNLKVNIHCSEFVNANRKYGVVLTSPPYGDSFTTVAYGQFSMFSNQWLGFKNARQIDNMLMGGRNVKQIYNNSIITDYVKEISIKSSKRALEVSSFYFDLGRSITNVAKSVKKKGVVFYITGNRRVQDVQLPTDQFIAEQFEQNGFNHLFTYERLLSNKSMPLKNSPSNKAGYTRDTMMKEYIVAMSKQ